VSERLWLGLGRLTWMKAKMTKDESNLRDKIFQSVRKILQLRISEETFTPGRDLVRYAAAVYDHKEIEGMVNAILDGWFGVGKYTKRFEAELAKFLGVKKVAVTNSGSSANLLAISSLLSDQVGTDVRLKPGDEVITPALTFPTTFNPILQNSLVPVLVDVEAGTYNVDIEGLKAALSDKTRGVFLPHTLGNPNDMEFLAEFAEEHGLLLVEDACDALGSKYDGRYVGGFGCFGTFSFYPAHQITTGEGGAIVSNDEKLAETALSMRDWGRACVMPVCSPLHCPDENCPRAASFRKSVSSGLPEDYDKRYLYTNIGYNFKPTEIQAAMGLAQLDKLPKFIEARKKNFAVLYKEFEQFERFFVLPEWLSKSDPCWFAFPLTIKEKAPFNRQDVVQWLAKHNIEVKMLFTGNILRHPAYRNVKCRVAQKLANSDRIMRDSFFLGVYPGLTEEKMKYMIETARKFMNRYV
jgi:CDP-6-deoxy-D-xylo-4-hexulose-3-dehydrase